MNDFNVRIIEDDSTIHLYPETSNVTIVDGVVSIDCESMDERAIHNMNQIDELIIKSNR